MWPAASVAGSAVGEYVEERGLTCPSLQAPTIWSRGALQGSEAEQQRGYETARSGPLPELAGMKKDSRDATEKSGDLDRHDSVDLAPGLSLATHAEWVMAGRGRRHREPVSGLENFFFPPRGQVAWLVSA